MIGFAGLSHLGIVSSIAAASKGYDIVAYGPDPALCGRLSSGCLPILEPDLPDLLAANRSRIRFTSDATALTKCELIVLSADVITDKDNHSDLSPLQQLTDKVVTHVSPGTVLVVLSQVPPGFTRKLADGLKRLHDDRGVQLFCQAETLIFGRAVERALHPERFIIGCSNPDLPLPPPLNTYLKSFGCPILPMRYESAELAKISINMCLVASVSVANVMAEICEHVGANWSEVVPALRLDKRIGQYSYIKPGLGIAGGNLERDLATVMRLSKTHGTDASLVSAWLLNSCHRKNWPFETLERMVLKESPKASIAVLGLAYKENTRSTKNSPALVLIEQLSPCRVTAYDPVVPVTVAGDHVIGAVSALDAMNGVEALVIITPWPEFKKIRPTDIKSRMKGRVVIDPYRMLDAEEVKAAGLDYATLGMPRVTAKP